MKNPILKGFTLTVFISLITIFIMYRSGYLNIGSASPIKNHHYDPNGSVIQTNDSTTHIIQDTHQPILIPSSKSIIIHKPNDQKEVNPFLFHISDSLIKLQLEDSSEIKIEKPVRKNVQPQYIPSTKSGRIYEPSK